MSTIKANTILPDDPAQDITLGASGDTISVDVKVVEGNRTRLQIFEGVVIAISSAGMFSK